jgi:hypothetical protein
MMDDESLHVLLARGRLSGPQRDRIFEHAFSRNGGVRRWERRAVFALAALLPVAAAVAFLLRSTPEAHEAEKARWLAAKGSVGEPELHARCPEREPGTCRTGDRLIFEVDGATSGGFFAAYADCEARERIWYYPALGASMTAIPATEGHSVLERAARIGQEHGVGRCVVHLFLLGRPVDRNALPSEASDGVTVAVPIVITP